VRTPEAPSSDEGFVLKVDMGMTRPGINGKPTHLGAPHFERMLLFAPREDALVAPGDDQESAGGPPCAPTSRENFTSAIIVHRKVAETARAQPHDTDDEELYYTDVPLEVAHPDGTWTSLGWHARKVRSNSSAPGDESLEPFDLSGLSTRVASKHPTPAGTPRVGGGHPPGEARAPAAKAAAAWRGEGLRAGGGGSSSSSGGGGGGGGSRYHSLGPPIAHA
jgi:hypothetical protein